MAFRECLETAVAAGVIDRGQADDLAERYRRQFEHERQRGAGAETRAAKTLADELAFEAADRKRRMALTARAAEQAVADMEGFRAPNGEADAGEGLIAILENYGGGFESLEGLRKFYLSEGLRRMDIVVEAFDRTKITGTTRNKPLQRDVAEELFGGSSGSAEAKMLADAWRETSEWLRRTFNSFGGAIGKLEHWGLPQAHDATALLRAGKDTWKEFVRPRLDLARMRHPKTGRPIGADEIDGILDTVYDTIATGGWSKTEPQMRPFGLGALAGRHGEARFLMFRDAGAWLEYSREFGSGGDVFEAMTRHVEIMARDIAALHRLGPNPEAMLHYLKQRLQRAAALKAAGKEAPFKKPTFGKDTVSRANRKIASVDKMWAVARGAASSPVSAGLASFGGNLRNLLVSAQLGSAVLSAVTTDPVFQAIARKAAGLPVMTIARDLARAVGEGGRMNALRSGLILDSALNQFGEQARWLDSLHGTRWSRYLADRTLQLSGLTPWTQANRHAFGLGFQAHAAKQAGKAFGELDKTFRGTLEGYGIDAKLWDAISGSPLHDWDGAKFLRPAEILERNEEAGRKYAQMILMETEFAVPSTTLRGRAALSGVARPGTWIGEAVLSGGMYKSFPASVILLHGMRTWRMFASGNGARGAAYAGTLLMTTMMGGALSLWLKDIAAGRDPRPIGGKDGNPAGFVVQAMLQGGGLGLFGDYIVADRNRYGGGLPAALAGPAAETVNSVFNLTIGNAIELAAGKDPKFAREAIRLSRSLTPGSSLWWASLAWQRVFLDQLNHLADPAATQAFKAQQRYWKNNYGNDFWWKPGEALPSGPPDLASAAGSR